VNDELSGGPGGRWPRWVRVAGALAVAAVVAVGGWRAGNARPTPVPEPTDTALPAPSLAVPVPLPTDFGALPAADRTGVRLLVGAQGLTEVDLDSGARRPVSGVPASSSGYRLDRADGGAVIVSVRPACRGCAHGTYVVPAGSVAAARLPGYDAAAPAAEPGLLWASRAAAGPGQPGLLRQVDLAGRPRGPDYRLPADRVVLRGTVAGLLTVRCCDTVELWEPRSGRRLRALQQVIAASATRLAWVPDGCVFDCTVTVTDLLGPRDLRYPLHSGGLGLCATFFANGIGQCASFSADGASLAVIAHRNTGRAGDPPARMVYLLTGGRITGVGARVGATLPDIGLALGWVGRRLMLATAGQGGRVRPPSLLLATTTVDRPELRVVAVPGLAGRAVVVR
jgi:hypothetical protein